MAEKIDITYLQDKFRRSYDILYDKREKWLKYFKFYVSSEKTTYNEYRESRLLPYAFSTIMSILPRMVNQMPKVRYMMRNIPNYFEDALQGMQMYGGETIDIEKLRKDAINALDYTAKYQWSKMRMDVERDRAILQSLIYGTAVSLVYWSEKDNAPALKTIEPFYFIPESGVINIKDMNYCFTINHLPKETVEKLFKSKVYKHKKWKSIVDSAQVSDYDLYQSEKRYYMKETYQTIPMLKVIEYYSKDEIITYIDSNIVRRIPNKLKELPFVVMPNYVVPGEFWGMSEIDQIEQFIKDMTDFRVNRHINIDLMSNTMWRIDPNKEVNVDTLVSAPGQIIEAEEGALEQMRVLPVSDNTYKEDAVMMNDIRETSGISDYMRGSTPNRFETATTVDNLVNSGNMRITTRMTNMVNYFIKPLGDLIIKYNSLYLKSQNIVVKTDGGHKVVYINNDFIKLIKDGDFDLITIPKDTESIKRTEFMQVLQIVMQTPQMAQMFDIKELMKSLFKTYNIPTAGLFKSDQQIQQEQQQQQELAMMQQQQQQGQQNNKSQSGQPVQNMGGIRQ